MKRAALLAAAGLAAAAPLAAQEEPAQPGRVHEVQRGETLWDIARTYLNDPFLWPEIFRLNTDVVEDPALIYPRERLVLPGGVVAQTGGEPGRTVFYRGDEDRDAERLTILPAGQGNFPVVRMGDFYRAAFVAADAEVETVGHVAELESPTVVPLTQQPGILPYNRVFVPVTAAVQIGDRLQFLRAGRLLPSHGRVWISTGMGTVAAVENNVATVVVTRMYDQVNLGDVAVAAPAFPVRAGVRPSDAARDLQGRVLAFELPHPAQSTEEIAFLDLGRQEGVREGDEFEVYLPREGRDWGTRPEIAVARVQVVKVTQGTASARITSLSQPALAIGLPVRRIARMPEGAGASGGARGRE